MDYSSDEEGYDGKVVEKNSPRRPAPTPVDMNKLPPIQVGLKLLPKVSY